jgi:hypothetical protein
MPDEAVLEEAIGKLGQEFHAWRQSHAWPHLVKAWSEDDATRAAGHREITEVFANGGRAEIEKGLTTMIGLQEQLAAGRGTTASQLYFHEDDALGKGIGIIEAQASAVTDRYFAFKAKLGHQDYLNPADIRIPVGNWGGDPAWAQSQEVAVAAFEPLGLHDLARSIAQHTATGPGQAFWNDYEPRLKDMTGVMASRLVAHEMGHAVHFTLAGSKQIRPDVAEIVSTLQETLFMKEMGKRAATPQQQMALLSNQLDADVAMVEQAGKLVFEKNAYQYAEAHPGEPIPITRLWREASGRILGNNINDAGGHGATLDARLMLWDQYMHQPGYASGYLIGWAAAPELARKLEADPESFKATYKQVLAQGDHISADQFLQAFGIDTQQPEFWQKRMEKMGEDVAALEALHRRTAMGAFVNQGPSQGVPPRRKPPADGG